MLVLRTGQERKGAAYGDEGDAAQQAKYNDEPAAAGEQHKGEFLGGREVCFVYDLFGD
jgi:hypothetical protein